MKKSKSARWVFACALVFGSVASASAASLPRSELIDRLRIRADVVVLGENGKPTSAPVEESRLLSGFSAEGKLKKDWSSESPNFGAIRLRHEWTIGPTGTIHVRFEEFSESEVDSRTGETKAFRNPIANEEKDLVDLGTIFYPVKASSGKRVAVRFTPELAPEPKLEDFSKRKISGRGVAIYDTEGALWASEIEMGAEYSAITTYRGTLLLSYAPFKGAEAAGVASGKRITIRMKDYPRVTFQSETDFVPEGTHARVFVKYIKERRTAALNAVKQLESSSEPRILASLKQD